METLTPKTKDEDLKSLGTFGIGTRNERGDKLSEFTEEHQLIIANTLFKKAKNRYWTWESPDGKTKNMIDLALCNKKEIISNCEVITKADKGSDHRLLRTRIKINKKLARLKSIKKQRPFRVDIQKLKVLSDTFQLNLKNRFEPLAELDANTFNDIIIKEASELASSKKNKDETPTKEDQDIREMDDRRKSLRKIETKTILGWACFFA